MDLKSSVETLRVSYDTKGDVVYLSFGEPRAAIGVEAQNGVVVRFDEETGDIVGATIIDFSKRFKNEPDNIVTIPTKESLMESMGCH
jgi:uncharacterized protein YuzE